MRVSGCLAALVFFGALILLTGLCSLTSFSLAQQTVVDLNAAGMTVDDPLATLRCALTGSCENGPLEGPRLRAPLLMLTPLTTALPTAAGATSPPVTVAEEETGALTVAPTAVSPTEAPGASLPRVTDPRQIEILLLGIDQRSATDDPGPFRTDTMMLLSVNPARKTVGVLSPAARPLGDYPRL